MISVGKNDIDTKNPEDIYKEYTEIIDLLRRKFPGIKIIVGEITPRKVNKNNEVDVLNKLLGDMCNQNDFLFLVDHSNLRKDVQNVMYDDKHIHKRAVSLFAGNFKRILRKAYGYPEPVRRGNVVVKRNP